MQSCGDIPLPVPTEHLSVGMLQQYKVTVLKKGTIFLWEYLTYCLKIAIILTIESSGSRKHSLLKLILKVPLIMSCN